MKYQGLSKKEAEQKLKNYGENVIRDVSKNTPLQILFRQIKSNFVIYFLFSAMIISFFVGKSVTAYAILVIVLVIIIVGFIQEYHAEQAINALKGMLVPITIVMREGKEQEIESKNLVPGDILVLRTGEKIPADCIILEEKELRVNESILTGESKEIKKTVSTNNKTTEENLLFMGSYIVNGRCVAKIIHTGMNTKFGKIAGLISTTEKELPLQNKVNLLTKYLVFLGIIISVLTGSIILFLSDAIDADTLINVLIVIIALAVAAFPESFPVVLITTLSSGAYNMAKKNAVVNRMSIIETLGETTVICSDKTGTITKGEMTVKKIFDGNSFYDVTGTGYESNGEFLINKTVIDISKESFFKNLFYNALLCNDSNIERTGDNMEFKTIGSPTESALLILGSKVGLFKEDINAERIEEIPFNSERKIMSVLYQQDKEKIVYTKGAPEYILKKCSFIEKNGKIKRLTDAEKKEILEANNKMTLDCLRTLGFAYKKVDSFSKSTFEENLIFSGLVGMEDPPREEVKETIKQCKIAGIAIKMITGDNKETALSVAKEIGLEGKLLEGHELEELTDEELQKVINSISIFARVKPEHKLRIVKALKANGEIVTMTGDGVNDAPALKEAHIGVAMGKNGTDVSRSVADLTLKDDDFSTIVLAISEGRTIFTNIRKFITYQLSCNFTELGMIFIGVLLSPFLGWWIPILVALQILFMNLVTADLPAVALGLNPSSKDGMIKPPRKNAEILNKKLIGILAFTGTLMTIMVLSSYYITYNIMGHSFEYARTIGLVTLIFFELVLAFVFRSFKKGVFGRSLFINKYLVYASLISLAATMAILYTPLNVVFETEPLGLFSYTIPVIYSFILVGIFDILKYINKKVKFIDVDEI